jgi:hypothetical protein
MLGPATRQCREIARRQSWFLHSAAPQVVPVVVVRTKRSRLRTRRFAQTAALPSVRTLHAPRAATSVQACRSRRASRPPDSRQRSVMTDRDDDLRRRFATTICDDGLHRNTMVLSGMRRFLSSRCRCEAAARRTADLGESRSLRLLQENVLRHAPPRGACSFRSRKVRVPRAPRRFSAIRTRATPKDSRHAYRCRCDGRRQRAR